MLRWTIYISAYFPHPNFVKVKAGVKGRRFFTFGSAVLNSMNCCLILPDIRLLMLQWIRDEKGQRDILYVAAATAAIIYIEKMIRIYNEALVLWLSWSASPYNCCKTIM